MKNNECKIKYDIGQTVYQVGFKWHGEPMFEKAIVAECVISQIRLRKCSAKRPWEVEYYCVVEDTHSPDSNICLGREWGLVGDYDEEEQWYPLWGRWISESEINTTIEDGMIAVAKVNTLPF